MRSITDDLMADYRAREKRLLEHGHPWFALHGFEPSFEAVRDQYSAEWSAAWHGWRSCEWSPAHPHDGHVRLWELNRIFACCRVSPMVHLALLKP